LTRRKKGWADDSKTGSLVDHVAGGGEVPVRIKEKGEGEDEDHEADGLFAAA